MPRAIWRTVFLLALPTGGMLAGQTPAIMIERTMPGTISLSDTGRIILTFRVTNRARVSNKFATRLRLPTGWRLIIPDSALTLGPGESRVQLLPILVPASVRAGDYRVRYEVGASAFRGDSSVADSVTVSVPARRAVLVSLGRSPRFVAAGSIYRPEFVVSNAGNAPATVQVSRIGDGGLDARLEVESFIIEPGDERHLYVEVRTSGHAPRKLVQNVGVSAKIGGQTTAVASAMATVEVIPLGTSGDVSRYGIPMTVGFSQFADGGGVSPSLVGSGYLSSARSTRVDFKFRAPTSRGFLADQDTYWLGINKPGRIRLRLGDQGYDPSRLTRSSRPTTGISGELALGPLLIAGLAQRDRRTYSFSREQAVGGNLDAKLFSDRARIGAGLVSRSGNDAATILTTRGRIEPFGTHEIVWELGHGESVTQSGGAYSIDLKGTMRILSYSMRREAADMGFPAFAAGMDYSMASLRLRPFRYLDLFGNAVRDVRQHRSAFTAPETRRLELEGGMNVAHVLGVAYRQTRDTGFVIPRPAGRTGKSARLFVRIPTPTWMSLSATAEEGFSVFDDQPVVRIPFHRLSGNVSATVRGQAINASIDHMKGTPVYGFSEIDETSGELGASLRIRDGTSVNANLNISRHNSTGQTFSQLYVGIGQSLAFGHRVSYRSQSVAYGAGIPDRTRQRLDYTIPFNVPTFAPEESGTIHVRLLDASRTPVPGVLVRLGGDARITDREGRARFVDVPADDQYLDVDRTQLGPGRIVAPVTPLMLSIGPGDEQDVELTITNAASVVGSVQLFDFLLGRPLGAPDSIVASGGYTGLRLQLTNNGDTLRALSNGGGHFHFGDLHPGRWVLTVSRTGVPAAHRLEQDRFELDLRPGDTGDITVRLLPVARKVRFIAEAELTPIITAALPPTGMREHLVNRADVSLMQVSRTEYADPALWPKLWLANRAILPRPEAIRVGQRLVVPSKAPLTDEEIEARDGYLWSRQRGLPLDWPRADRHWRAPAVRHWYTATVHDVSLVQIARVMYDDASLWPKIWVANLDQLDTPDRLRPGTRLRVPEAAPLTSAEKTARDAYYAHRR